MNADEADEYITNRLSRRVSLNTNKTTALDGKCPNPSCYKRWHGFPTHNDDGTIGCPGSHEFEHNGRP